MCRALGEAFAVEVQAGTKKDRRFTVALSGGSTPRPFYELLASELRDRVPWSQVHLFWSDERYVPLDDPDSNYRLVRETLLDAISIPPENVHPAPTDHEDPDQAARVYERELRSVLSVPPELDWVLLGLGEDGHVASLFPGAPALEEKDRWVVAVTASPKPPPVRLTMTLPLINAARSIHLLVSGASKTDALRGSLEDPGSQSLPAHRIGPTTGRLHWWLDQAAAGFLANK